ncbi:glucose-6-phosphate isomerase [Brachyspira hyodysenteriae]|uniref:Glucose-6-phosphate isomerase n=1 Tax=Brachyspira hyodysenteriae ATCC 27164 TaxID=1266923 RepID=A0A3B6VT52_BRAHO|nr:glucose-6-phosphate isomerase [Brachyspira hyodysenteriae]ANN64262.1 glucose-6-phosphate isomerase [Brachyspira hyodysenteriae ATCC 27164]KLI14618.1 glucose-6-phosphate isomerase [Brachyspira hyodysenteriae]KLI17880.1 glucose-6-phosphate isomerase [Brachyspira hyodysenteriae]KLI18487.1 glucose-6-phosphate isomerase [Brachyspira hyodysenteriae]KLI26871.1 glucose-6-phosphate isomerase [Brachyspira hyodysenteriae]
MLSINYKNVLGFLQEHELEYLAEHAKHANELLENKKGAGNDFLGWVNLPTEALKMVKEIDELAKEIRENAEVLVSVGIGGSYLGGKAVIESFLNPFSQAKKGNTQVVYAGHNMNGEYFKHLLDYLEGKDFYINVISKSGTTTEPAIAFRMLKEYAEKRYGKDGAAKRIIATTDKAKGALKTLSTENKYRTFVIPDDVGGRYSVLTPVGLIPIAVSGINIEEFVKGFDSMAKITKEMDYKKNPSMLYAMIRNALYAKGYSTEIMVNYIPRMHYISEWWKQLYGESEGKDKKGIFPASVDFSTDLHSLGQFIQDGKRGLFETVIRVDKEDIDLKMKKEDSDLDGLNYLDGKTLHEINKSALEATVLAHVDGGVPNIIIDLDKITPFTIGELLYFFEKACGISGHILGVNPFDQPGVEAYKKNMFAMLGKKGYEEMGKTLRARLGK